MSTLTSRDDGTDGSTMCGILSVLSVSSLPSCLTGRDLIWFLALTLEMVKASTVGLMIVNCDFVLNAQNQNAICVTHNVLGYACIALQ